MKKFLPQILFIFAIFTFSFGAGALTAETRTFPYGVLRATYIEARDFLTDWMGYLGLRPSKFFLKDTDHHATGVTIYKKEEVADGLTLMSGLFDNKVALQLIELNGTVIRYWSVDFDEIWPNPAHVLPEKDRPRSKWGFHIQGMAALRDGSVVFNAGSGLVKMNHCGDVIWKVPKMTHHSVFVEDDGTFWVPNRIYHETPPKRFPGMRNSFIEDTLLHISPDGEVIREISFLQLLYKSGLYGLLAGTGDARVRSVRKGGGFVSPDPTHINDIEVFSASNALLTPGVKAGDLLVSSRDLNLIIAFDPDTLEVKWYQVGPWLRQHDPDILPDGHITIFNNNTDDASGRLFGGSNILKFSAKSRRTEIIYPKGMKNTFYSDIMGTHQQLPNGNLLITESMSGRVFEVSERGNIVWEYVNGYNKERVALIEEAQRYDRSYFQISDWACPE